MTRTDRVLHALKLLASGDPYGPEDLADAFDTSKRTAYRDLNILHRHGLAWPDGEGTWRVDGRLLLYARDGDEEKAS